MSLASERTERLSAARAELEIRADLDLAERGRFSIVAQAFIPVILYYGGDYARDMPRAFLAACCWYLLIALGRVWLLFRLRRSVSSRLKWLVRIFHLNVAVSALGWGLFTSSAFVHYGPTDWNTYLALMLSLALSTGSMATLASHYPLLVASMSSCSVPLILAAILSTGRAASVSAFGIFVYCVSILILGRRLNLNYWAGLRDNALLQVHMEELEYARRAAEQASRVKGEFLANMSHELRTPMNGVLGMTELVLDSELSREQRECLVLADTSARTLLKLLDKVIDYSRIESGHFHLNESPFNLRALLDGIESGLKSECAARGLVLQLELDARIPAVLVGDHERLHCVLASLLDNAIRFTEKGSITLAACLVEDSSVTDWRTLVEFEVRDTGIGIPPEKQRAIFEAFTQADSSPSRRHSGLGLGLAAASSIVRLMGGRISLESSPGFGSRFFFRVSFVLPSSHPVEQSPLLIATPS